MKIHILYRFQEIPWGGGNQFLKVLKKEFKEIGCYEESPKNAAVILFNSYPFGYEYLFHETLQLKNHYPKKIVIFRLDGPISFVRGKDKEVDKIIALFNNLFVDGIIFQSNWAKEKNKKLFEISSKYETVIHNAPDNKVFNRIDKKEFNPKEKIKLITTSWSCNWQKGFGIYEYLDENLDISKYEMTFVGNSPIEFKNIRCVKPVPSEMLAEILRQHDIYITASQNDPCSNALIEALSCGLPAVALSNGGHPELVQNGGGLFTGEKDVMKKIEKVAQNYQHYQSQIPEFSMKKVAQNYYKFARKTYEDFKSGKYNPKKPTFSTKINFCKMKVMILRWKAKNKLEAIRRKTWKE